MTQEGCKDENGGNGDAVDMLLRREVLKDGGWSSSWYEWEGGRQLEPEIKKVGGGASYLIRR